MPYDQDDPPDLKASWAWLVLAGQLPADYATVPAAGGSGLVASGRHILVGGSLTNAATVAGSVQILDGQDAKGALVATVNLPASATTPFTLPNRGVFLEIGAFVVVTGATLSGVLYVIHLWKYPFTPPGE